MKRLALNALVGVGAFGLGLAILVAAFWMAGKLG